MLGHSIHPNTKAMLQAWRRLNPVAGAAGHDPMVEDCRGMLGRLFVLQRVDAGVWTFRNTGEKLEDLLGRDLTDQNFLSLWSGADRTMISGLMTAIENAANPAIVRARGETLNGRRVEIEIPLAPLDRNGEKSTRMLGLYQALGGEAMLGGRPVIRHRLSSLTTPDMPITQPKLRLVASND